MDICAILDAYVSHMIYQLLPRLEFELPIYLQHFLKSLTLLQLNEYEMDPYFLQFFQSNMTVSLIIHVFCKSCEPEIVFVLIRTLAKQFYVRKSYKTHESTL